MADTSTASLVSANPDNLPPLLTTAQAAALGLGTERSVRRMCESGTIKAVKLPGARTWRVNRDALLMQLGLA